MSTTAKKIAQTPDETITFWQHEGQVYRAVGTSPIGPVGMPLGIRWECSLNHWNHYRSVFSWAEDV